MRRLLLGLVLAAGLGGSAIAQTADPAETKALHAIFGDQWETGLRRAPERATLLGDLRYNDRWSDDTRESRAETDRLDETWLARARAIRRDRLSATDQVSLDLFITRIERGLAERAFTGFRNQRIGALGGTQTGLSDFLRQVPVRTPLQVRQLLQRLEAYPRVVDNAMASMREAAAVGWVPPAPVLTRALQQIDAQLASTTEAGVWFEPFRRLGADVPAADQQAFRALGKTAIEAHVVPAVRKLRVFIVSELQPKAAATGALRDYPDGARLYDLLVANRTTTQLNARQVHDIGLREVAALRAEMEAVMRRVKFEGSFERFIEFLHTDPRFFHENPDALLAGYRSLAKRIDAEMPRLFAELPRAPYGVRAMPAHRGPDAAEYYDGPAQDGSRAGFFNANVVGFKSRPIWRMPTLTAHEAVPGHHLQVARAIELQALPPFRRQGGYVAFSEGWGVYAETLGREIGLYEDPYDYFGHLQDRIFRAARLVVDTGIHSLGWSRAQAIDYMTERTGMDRPFVTAEIDRYISTPGQALGYMIGALKIQELRDRAKSRLGERFDVRRFHNAVLDNGAVPLDVLERLVDQWIERERAR